MPFPNKTFSSKEVAIAAGRKGGRKVTEKKRIAYTLAAWKRFGVPEKCGEKGMLMMKSKGFSAADWYKHIDLLEKAAEQDPKLIPMIVNMKRDFAKFAHGDKLVTENTHHIINWSDMLSSVVIVEEKDEESEE